MDKKIISIFVCTLMFATVFSAVAKQDTTINPSEITVSTENSNTIKTLTFEGKTVYAWAFNGMTAGPIKFDLENPAGATSIKASATSPFAGSWVNDIWYAITYTTNQLITIDPETGTETLVAPITGVSGTILGMAYDDVTAKCYGIWSPGSGTVFYEIDLTTGAATNIGTWSSDILIDIACDSNGLFYGPALNSDKLYLVDPTVPSATEVGSLGIALNYAQGAAFDKDTDILYLAAYTGSGSLYTCDTTTGLATKVGDFPSSAEVDALAIPYITNFPPNTPAAPNGPDSGVTNVEYSFTATTTDPEGDPIEYMFDWGDSTTSNWLTEGSASHAWTTKGTFDVKVKARDSNGGESDWSTAHPINIVVGPVLQVDSISGGLFKVKARIRNMGEITSENVEWKIELVGGAFIGKSTTGTIPSMVAGGGQEIESKLIIGWGPTVVKVTATVPLSSVTEQADGNIYIIYIKI